MDAFYKIAQPVDYYKKFLEQDCRPDGRQLAEFREVVINTGSITTADGSAFVKIGETSVMCGIKAELASPKEEEPSCGYIVPNVELSPMCSPQFKAGAPGELAQTSSHFLQKLLISSHCLSLDDLCIEHGKACWVLYCDLLCLNYDGNLLDVCCLALITALKNVRLPKATFNEETEVVDVVDTQRSPLDIKNLPVSTTFAIFSTPASDMENIVIGDPTFEEESLTSGQTTIVTLNGDEELCMVYKPGGAGLTDEKLTRCLRLAHQRTPVIQDLISNCSSSKSTGRGLSK